MQATRYDKLPNEDDLIGNRIFRRDETYRRLHRSTSADERCRLRKSYFFDENTLADVLRRSEEDRKTKERVAFSKTRMLRERKRDSATFLPFCFSRLHSYFCSLYTLLREWFAGPPARFNFGILVALSPWIRLIVGLWYALLSSTGCVRNMLSRKPRKFPENPNERQIKTVAGSVRCSTPFSSREAFVAAVFTGLWNANEFTLPLCFPLKQSGQGMELTRLLQIESIIRRLILVFWKMRRKFYARSFDGRCKFSRHPVYRL